VDPEIDKVIANKNFSKEQYMRMIVSNLAVLSSDEAELGGD